MRLEDWRHMLQPSKHAVIRDYEHGQDSIGAWFEAARIGLHRGERHKEKIRQALQHNRQVREAQATAQTGDTVPDLVEVPKHRAHVSPRQWREAQETRLMERDDVVTRKEVAVSRRAGDLDAREKTAETQKRRADIVLRTAKQIANGEITSEDLGRMARDTDGSVSSEGDTTSRTAAQIFARAMRVLNDRAEKRARAHLGDEFEAIRQAGNVIVSIARRLPSALRARIANARTSLTSRIVALDRMLGRGTETDRSGGRED
ncbi:hypothetical protein [Pontivivens ytuae]|uniref:Uncharacterized protein n=1 Tax=Pontivivens ytuae TaxID=2789856 RepID=A0A7S9QCA0_9RHOB|nr:hypothetical protein [Pontivivens ytuae]QPH53973.1 hypothetical protein I0K15_19735 [Pontivivens ytuae]